MSEAKDGGPPKLMYPPARSINKIGHGLLADPVFREVTTSDKVKDVARSLEKNIKDPRVLQTMIICKQPRIGGVGELRRAERQRCGRVLVARVCVSAWAAPRDTRRADPSSVSQRLDVPVH